jgi:hypothetical protein
MTALKVVDLNGDAKRELLAAVGTGYELKPRGLYCFDYEEGGLLWRYDTGPYLTDVVTLDLDGDAVQEVVFGTYAVNNGNRAQDGTDDGHSYVCALTSKGEALWIREMEGPFTRTHPIIANVGTGQNEELAVWVSGAHEFRTNQNRPEVGGVLRLNAAGNTIASYDAGARLISCVAADLDGDGVNEMIATDRHGFLHALEHDLTLREKVSVITQRFDVVHLAVAAVTDLDGDGRPEIVLSSSQEEYVSGLNQGEATGPPNVRFSHDVCVVVLSHDLKPLARYVVAEKWKAYPGFSATAAELDGDGRRHILSLSDKALVLEYVSSSTGLKQQ